MTFDEVLAQVQALLQQEKRVSYRGLKRRFALDDEYLEDLKEELIGAKRLATDEDGRFLVRAGGTTVVSSQLPVVSPQSLALSTQHSEASRLTLHAARAEGERRQLTVQFIDLVGSTTLSQQLDPEDYHGRVVAYQAACHQVIARYEGHIAQYLGDGMLVYFGYPAAHEEDAVRAVRSGLEIVTTVSQLAYVPPLQVRIGIHTGPVVVGEIGAGERIERLALGETPNIAARIQGIAEPNTMVISAATARLVQGLFECQDRGPQELKGVSTSVPVYRVLRESEAQSRFEVALSTGLTPLVGRDLEVGLLRERWAQTKEGAGQVVLLSGEPGIGKSRLIQALKEQAIAEGATQIECRCSPYHQNSALYPIIEHLERFLQFHRAESPSVKIERLQQVLARYRFPQADTLALLAALLSLPSPEGAPPLTLSPQKQKQKTLDALVAWLVEEAERQAVYCAWEDLHWADPSTLELLTLLLEQVPTTRLLALLTFRPEFLPPWRPRAHLTQLTLNRLGRHPVEAMVENITGGKALPREVVQQLVAKTDGVPLFVEELTKTVLESVESIESVGSGGRLGRSALSLGIPATLQDALMARLDRLGPAKEIAQIGATIGREFSYELLHVVSPIKEEALQHGLRELVEAELVYQRGVAPQATYLFKHALIQDMAYQALLKSKRQQYHKQISKMLEEQFPQTVETQPELVAHHYTEAGLSEQAIPYWRKAGERAIQRSANVEAVSHLTKGLEVLKILPDTPERTQRELFLQAALGPALMATKGWSAPEVGAAYTRALELCRQVGATPQLSSVLGGLWAYYAVRAEVQPARELAEQLLSLAQKVQDPLLFSEAYYGLGFILLFQGEFAPARAHLEQGLTFYDPQQHRSDALLYGYDSGMTCAALATWTLWYLGYPDQALKRMGETLTLTRALSHPYSLALVLDVSFTLHQFCREVQVVQEQADAAIALSTEQGFQYWLAWGTTLKGWALGEQGQREEGIAQLRNGLAAYQDTGAELWRSYQLALLAEAYGKVGQTEEGLKVLTEALAVVDKNEERFCEAELYRLKGTLTLQEASQKSKGKSQKSKIEPNPQHPAPSTYAEAEAEACFHKAIDIAHKQQAKSLELRATVSLARLWQRQDKQKEAHLMLSEIYGWFTEGLDTKDLQEAKALLDDLQP